jgi:lysophospholipase L1-like esterase
MVMRRNRTHPNSFVLAVLLGVASAAGAWPEESKKSNAWEKDIAAFERQDRAKPPPKNAVVFVGSSSIRFWDVAKSFPGMDAINRGFGGSQLADSVRFAPRIVVPYEPRIVVLYAGDNDLAFGKSPEQVAADFEAFTRVVLGKLPKTKLIFLSIKPSPLRSRLTEKVHKANALIEAYCKTDQRLLYIDVGTALLGSDGKPRKELFRRDGLHLNEKGYEVWNGILKPHLAQTAQSPKEE